jgi:hypothetical protein
MYVKHIFCIHNKDIRYTEIEIKVFMYILVYGLELEKLFYNMLK